MAPWRQALASSEPRAIAPASTQGSGANVHSALAVLTADGAPSAGASQGAAGTMASSGGLAAAPKRKQVSVTEMLEYVKGLDIDPIKEADMLWIAEEAFNANPPPGWSEHQDDQGRVYFHNGSTGESTWRHPMDDLFREIVDYQRRVVKAGGFWQVEDEIAELEENIRLNLADWMELYDEHGEKFFYNRKNDESRFDDPRMAVYHSLYARIKLVAKMKERLPVLARAPRPEEPTEQDVEIQKRMEEEEKRYLTYLIKLQSFARVILAKRKKRLMQALRTVQKGPQPLRGKLRLRMEKLGPGGGKELVLSQTTGHRKARAATKIQARVRGMLARRRFRPLVMHRTYLSKVATKIQATMRVWLAKRRCARLREDRLINAAVNIQRVYRGYRDRQYVSALRAEKLRYEWMMKCVVLIQSGIRMHLAYKECKRRRYQRFATCIKLIKRQVKVFLVRDKLNRDKLKLRPIQAALSFNPDPKSQSMVPWSWKMWTTPPVFGLQPTPLVAGAPLIYTNIFSESGPEYYKDMAATRIQSRARAMLARKRMKVLKEVADDFWMEVFVKLQVELEERRQAAIQVQKVFRGKHLRSRDVLAERKEEQLLSRGPQIKMAQAYIKRFFAQEWLQAALVQYRLVENSTKIQAHWRGWLARRHVERLYEEALWPMKGWFEYTATGREIVHLEVRFLPNPGFDDYRYFVKHGSYDELELDMVDVDDVIARVLRKHPEEETPTPSKATPDGNRAQSRPSSAPRSRRASKAESVASRAPSAASRASSRVRSASEDASGKLQRQSVAGSARLQHEQTLEEVAEDDGRGASKASVASRPSRGPKNLPLPPAQTDGEAGSAVGPASHRSRKSSREPTAQVTKPVATEEVQPPPVPPSSTMPNLPEEPEDEAAVQAPDAAAPEATSAAAAAKQKPTSSAAPAAKTIRRPGRGGRSTSASKASSKAAPAPAEGEHSAAAGSDSATEAAHATDSGHAEGLAPAEPQSAVEVTLLADEERPLDRQPTLEYSVASDGEPDDPSREREQSTHESPQEPQSQLLKRQPRQFGKVAKPRKKSPPAQPRERDPIAGSSHMSLAQTFLVEAPRQYADARAPRAKEDEPRPPKARVPSEPPAPAPPGSVQDLSASSSAAALRGTQARLEADAAAPAVPVKRKTYGGTLEGGKFVRTQAESVDELGADAKKEILEDLLAAKKKKEHELLEKQKVHKARRKQEEASKAEKMNATMSEAEAHEEDRQHRKVKELKKWLKKKEEETRARKARDAEMLKMVMDKESKKSETMKKLEKDRLAQREKRLRQAELQRAHLEAKLMMSRDASRVDMPPGDTMYPPATMLPPGMLPPMQHPAAPHGRGSMAPWQEQQYLPEDAFQQQLLLQQLQQQQQQQLQQQLLLQQQEQLMQQQQQQQLDPQMLQQQQQQQLDPQMLQQQQQQLDPQMLQQQPYMPFPLQLQPRQSMQEPSGYPFQQPLDQPLQEGALQEPIQQSGDMDALQQLDASQQPADQPMQLPSKQPLQYPHLEQLHQVRKAMSRNPQAQRVVHRHIHHHVHYHEGSDPDSGGEEQRLSPAQFATTSPEQQRQIEMASEARVRTQLEAAGPGAAPGMPRSASAASAQHRGLPSKEDAQRALAWQRSASLGDVRMGSLGPGMPRQDATRHASLPALDVDLGRRQGSQGLARYAGSVQRAIGSYSDSGRPRLARPMAAMG